MLAHLKTDDSPPPGESLVASHGWDLCLWEWVLEMWISVWKATKSDAVHGKHYRRGASEPPHLPICPSLPGVPIAPECHPDQLDPWHPLCLPWAEVQDIKNKKKRQDPKSRYGGWREGLETNSSVPANAENSAVYFNNKVCEMIVILVERNLSIVQMLGITRNGCTCDSGYNL